MRWSENEEYQTVFTIQCMHEIIAAEKKISFKEIYYKKLRESERK